MSEPNAEDRDVARLWCVEGVVSECAAEQMLAAHRERWMRKERERVVDKIRSVIAHPTQQLTCLLDEVLAGEQ